ncbi:hypothetical protein PV325_010868 [Microctonus aethiopoides]|uniref:Uncharacterized protein n=1 Tax=Microctonus aethiopoides TaxID=144406 RepID=A0AA39C750_9HYME|nr:hypothetical protein PV325_010868 [Microctonus aethiopoides]KAK0159159.1 hypothetical protein PV328_010080 [Microctonus aethiopoides]
MSNKKPYRRLLPSNSSSHINSYKTQSGQFNYQQTNNNPSSWITPREVLTQSSSRKILLKSSVSNITKSQLKCSKSKNSGQRSGRNRKRIELLSQPKFREQNQSRLHSSSSSTNSANVGNSKSIIDKQLGKSIISNSSSTCNRFRTVTPRLLRLAQPKIYYSPADNFYSHEIEAVEKPEIMKMPSRFEELAVPKKFQYRTNKDPFKVNPKALKASCSTRIEELARPKGFSQPFSQLLQDYMDRAFVGS